MKCVIVLLGVLVLSGCNAVDFTTGYERAKEARVATTQAISVLEVEIAALPPGDPVRKAAETKLAKAKAGIAKLDQYLPALEAAIRASQTGDLSDPILIEAVKVVPYGSLALALFGIGYAAVERHRKQKLHKAVTQVVSGLDDALPEKTDEQKLKLAAAQDESTKKIVAAVKGE